jgi:diacylglycerol kinase family enzyme
VRLLLIANESASSVTARSRVIVTNALGTDHDLEVATTNRRGHATRLAEDAARDGIDVVVVLGGDGTLNEAATGLAGTTTALGALPGGSTNVYARSLGFENESVAAVVQLLNALAAGSFRRVPIGVANGRTFLFHIGIGFDAAVVERVERRGHLKRWLGHPLFAYSTVMTHVRDYDHKTPNVRVVLDSGEELPDTFELICLASDPYTYLGSRALRLAARADLNAGLALVSLTDLGFFKTAGNLAQAARAKPLNNRKGIDYREAVRALTVSGISRPIPYQVDGDFLGYVDSLSIAHQPAALRVVDPNF